MKVAWRHTIRGVFAGGFMEVAGERPSRVATVASQLRQIEPRATLSAERKPDLSFFPATQGFDHDIEPSRWPQPVR